MYNIQIVCCEKGWILEAIARQWQQKLSKFYNVELVFYNATLGADLYFHFIHISAKPVSGKKNIVYVTHISDMLVAMRIKKLSLKGCSFITMSEETCKNVRNIVGTGVLVQNILPESLHFNWRDRGKNSKLTFGYFSRYYSDGRKNEDILLRLINKISNFSSCDFIIYGSNWLEHLTLESIPQNIYIDESQFQLDKYRHYLEQVDYVLYFSVDEGAVSILDAATLNIPVIATNIGYHKELPLAKGSVLCSDGVGVYRIVVNLIQSYDNSFFFEFDCDDTKYHNLIISNSNYHFRENLFRSNVIRWLSVNYVYSLRKNITRTVKCISLDLFNWFCKILKISNFNSK